MPSRARLIVKRILRSSSSSKPTVSIPSPIIKKEAELLSPTVTDSELGEDPPDSSTPASPASLSLINVGVAEVDHLYKDRLNHLLPHPSFLTSLLRHNLQRQQRLKISSMENLTLDNANDVVQRKKSAIFNTLKNTTTARWLTAISHYLANIFRPVQMDVTDDNNTVDATESEQAETKPNPRHVLVFGVHGWFPGKLLQKVVGVPRGTSTRLCQNMQAAIKRTIKKDAAPNIEEEEEERWRPRQEDTFRYFPLEGEGKIDARVNLHYAQIVGDPVLMGLLRQSSTTHVFLVGHSQGTAVTALLIQRLLKESILDKRKHRIGFLALAGIFQGPLPALKSNLYVQYVEAEAARELFLLNDPRSDLSLRVQAALSDILQSTATVGEDRPLFDPSLHPAKIMTVGSWHDQVVPLYSSCMLAVQHPSIYRALYIDENRFSSDFLTHLTELALRLVNTNIGTSETSKTRFAEDKWRAHTLLAHLTPYLAGNLYSTHNSHSNLYDDPQIYANALQWFLTQDQDVKKHPKGKETADSLLAEEKETANSSKHAEGKETGSSLFSEDILQFPLQAGGSGSGLDHPSYIPWIVRGLLEDFDDLPSGDDEGKKKPSSWEVLKRLHGEWNPSTPALKELKRRLGPLQGSCL